MSDELYLPEFEGYLPGVVIVEDKKMLHRLYKDILGLLGLKIVADYYTGKEFVDLFMNDEPVIVVLNHRMPEMTGLEALKIFRERDKDSFVIIETASTDTEEEYRKAGADVWLQRPTTIQGMIAAIQEGVETIQKRIASK